VGVALDILNRRGDSFDTMLRSIEEKRKRGTRVSTIRLAELKLISGGKAVPVPPRCVGQGADIRGQRYQAELLRLAEPAPDSATANCISVRRWLAYNIQGAIRIFPRVLHRRLRPHSIC
jgi:hypothetical protein